MLKRHNFLAMSLTIAVALLTTGCLDSDTLSAIEYNNEVVDILNSTSAAIEETTTVYDVSVPNIVTETSEIDTDAIQTSYDEAIAEITAAESVLTLKSSNEAQQTAIVAAFEKYLDLGNAYLSTYNDMINYYSSGYFVEELDGVATYDELLHIEYNDFIESNNSLVDVLTEYVD